MQNLTRPHGASSSVAALLAFALLIPYPGADASASEPLMNASSLVRMSEAELDALYRGGAAVALPPGRVRGTALLAPGTRRNGLMAAGARLAWQGKIIDPAGGVATNRFFGLSMVQGQLSEGPSWLDGAPALILDYSRTSKVYARNRDEIRQVAPGLFLGLMYARATPRPVLKMYFVLEVGS